MNLFGWLFYEVTTPTIDTKTADELEAPFSVEELKYSAEVVQNGKSPDNKIPVPDGFLSEFFLKIIVALAPILLLVFNKSSNSSLMPETVRQAVISFLPFRHQ